MRLVNSLPIFSTLTVVIAWDFGFFSRGVNAAQQTLTDIKPPTYRVAIIGAGAGGSSAAFWIEKARERHGMEVEVHIYDKVRFVSGPFAYTAIEWSGPRCLVRLCWRK